MMEEIWNIAKRDILVLQSYTSSADFKSKISRYSEEKDSILILGTNC